MWHYPEEVTLACCTVYGKRFHRIINGLLPDAGGGKRSKAVVMPHFHLLLWTVTICNFLCEFLYNQFISLERTTTFACPVMVAQWWLPGDGCPVMVQLANDDFPSWKVHVFWSHASLEYSATILLVKSQVFNVGDVHWECLETEWPVEILTRWVPGSFAAKLVGKGE